MKTPVLTLFVVVAASGLISSPKTRAETLGFANVTESRIVFNGDGTFDFATTSGNPNDQFMITSSDGMGDSVGDLGNVAGTFTIGAISGDQAAVTGSGALTIYGPTAANSLTGIINWTSISYGSSGTLNVTGILDLTGITYVGAQKDLQVLAASGSAEDKLSFTFTSPETLGLLKTTATSTTYAGVINNNPVPPVSDGGTTILFLGLGLGMLGWRVSRPAA
jgi:hypothetical protein